MTRRFSTRRKVLKSIIFRRANSPPVRPLSQRDIWECDIGRGDGARAFLLPRGKGLKEHPDRVRLVAILPLASESPGFSYDSSSVYESTLRAEPVHHAYESRSEIIRESLPAHEQECSISAIGAGGTDGGHLSHFPLDIRWGMCHVRGCSDVVAQKGERTC